LSLFAITYTTYQEKNGATGHVKKKRPGKRHSAALWKTPFYWKDTKAEMMYAELLAAAFPRKFARSRVYRIEKAGRALVISRF
jgi:hypothetical protein